MINVNLTEDERKQLIDETNDMLFECDELVMDLMGLSEQLSRISFFQRITNPDNKEMYNNLRHKINIKSRRLLCLKEKIETNKEILGLKKSKKKNKTL